MESWYVAAVLNRCPACAEGQLFSGVFQLRKTCDVCRVRYERWEGSWTGPTVIGYGVGAAVAVFLIVVLHSMDKLVPGSEIGIALASCVAVLATFRPVKAAWIGLLFDWGYVYPDPPKQTQAADPT